MTYSTNRILILASVMLLGCLFVSTAGFGAAYERTYTVNADFAQGVSDGVNYTAVPDQIQLNVVPTTFGFAWIANSGEGTVSKIDTTTGIEVARYRTGPQGGVESPSRTAIDILGNCWVGNRGTGTVVKILNEGGVNTSTGPADVKAWGTDDRVVLSVPLGSSSNSLPRAAAIDKNGNVWIGLYNETRYAVLDGNTGMVLAYVPAGIPPYGAAIDKNGILWSASVGWGIERIDTNTRASLGTFYFGTAYGIAVDANGFVWVGGYPYIALNKFNSATNVNQGLPSPAPTCGRGVCIAPNGDVWVALGLYSSDHSVAKYDQSGNLMAVYNIAGSLPMGVGTDFDGNILVVCQASNDVYKLNEASGAVMWHVPVGLTPYTYSDFTGYAVRNLTQKTGTWTTTFDSGQPAMAWGKAGWNSSTPGGSSVGVQVRAADASADLASQTWLDVLNNQDFGPINGRFIEVKARLSTTTEASPILYDIKVQAANHPPDAVDDNVVDYCKAPTIIPVLGNDTDPDGDTLTVTSFTQGNHGSVSLNPDGTLTFTPAPSFCGTDTFKYTISDGKGGSDTATVRVTGALVPILGGIPQVLDLDPIGYAPVIDPNTNQPVIDPTTGLPLVKRTWENYMYFATQGKAVQLQSVSLQKIIPVRKVACGAAWPTDKTTVQQIGIDAVNLRWPLAYEVNGTEFRLTVQYTTSERLAYPPIYGPNLASRSHLETYSWVVQSNTWGQFYERLLFFAKQPAGTCETYAVSPVACTKIQQFLTGYGNPAFGNFQPGIMQLIQLGQPIPAAARFSDLEAYLDSVCFTDCSGLYLDGNRGTPDPKAESVLDNPSVPADSLLINDLWAVGKALNILTDKK